MMLEEIKELVESKADTVFSTQKFLVDHCYPKERVVKTLTLMLFALDILQAFLDPTNEVPEKAVEILVEKLIEMKTISNVTTNLLIGAREGNSTNDH